MIHSYSPATADNESLQADVMRFMAIIAFCLIAILALVKEVEPTPMSSAREQAVTTADTPAIEQPAIAETSESRAWQAPIAKPEADVDQIESTPKPKPDKPRLEISDLTAAEPEPAAAPPSVDADPEPAAAPAQTQAEAAESEESEGLSLRFASPGDFLRLIARDQIQVYAFNSAGDVLGLSASYDFQPARSPGKVYELLPATIPALIIDALRNSAHSLAEQPFSWGITLPENIEHEVVSYVQSLTSGELVIDRYGEVHHVASR